MKGQVQHHGHNQSLLILSTDVWLSPLVPFRFTQEACQFWLHSVHLYTQSLPAEEFLQGQADFFCFFPEVLWAGSCVGDCSLELEAGLLGRLVAPRRWRGLDRCAGVGGFNEVTSRLELRLLLRLRATPDESLGSFAILHQRQREHHARQGGTYTVNQHRPWKSKGEWKWNGWNVFCNVFNWMIELKISAIALDFWSFIQLFEESGINVLTNTVQQNMMSCCVGGCFISGWVECWVGERFVLKGRGWQAPWESLSNWILSSFNAKGSSLQYAEKSIMFIIR